VSELDDLARSFDVAHVEGANMTTRNESVAHEEPLEIRVNGASVAVLMRTPGDDLDLVRGFIVSERIASREEIESVRHCTTAPDPESEDNVVDVRLTRDFDLERFRRHTFASSSCGVCGKATIENACAVAPPLADDVRVPAEVLSSLPAKLRAAQRGFDATGGVHAAGAFTSAGDLVVVREDVGRHNAVDKVIGASTWVAPVLLVSGRVSFEIVQKAAAARIAVVAGISAPSSLAVRMARALNVTVVGFLRGPSMNVYAAELRVILHRRI
jgi:FdhD protein